MDSIAPCTHCGGDGGIFTRPASSKVNHDMYAVVCDYADGGCGAQSGWYLTEEDAVAAWNRRDREDLLVRLAHDLDACRNEPKCCNCRHYRGEDADPWCGLRIEERVGELGALPD